MTKKTLLAFALVGTLGISAVAWKSLLEPEALENGQSSALISPAQAMGGNNPPEADAGLDRTAALGEIVVLDGTGTTDPKERKLQSFTWTRVSAPAGSLATLDDAGLIKPSFTVDLAGDYVFELEVSQGNRTSTPDQVVISTVNSVPVADAGRHQLVSLGQTVELDGSGSFDMDGDGLTYSWSLTQTPAGSGASLSDPAAVRPNLFIAIAGSYTAELVVNDGTASSAVVSVVLSSDNLAPASDGGPDRGAQVGEIVILTPGAALGNPNSEDIDLDWALIGRPAGSASSLSSNNALRPSFTIDQPGTYIVQLVAAEQMGSETPTTLAIDTANNPPLAAAGPDRAAGIGEVITLDAGGSSDQEGDPLSYAWSLTAVPAGSGAALDDPAAVRPSFNVDLAGTYVAQVIVSDGSETARADSVAIDTVNSPPSANAGPDQTVAVNATVQLDAAASGDPDNDPLTYSWTLLDRPNGPAVTLSNPLVANPTFQASKAGDYFLQVIVSDGSAQSAPDTVLITTGNSRPIADAGVDQEVATGAQVALDGNASSDADNDTLTYAWALLHRPVSSTAVLTNATSVTPSLTPDLGGTYVAQLVVRDGSEASLPDTVVIESNEAPIANAGADQTVKQNTLVTLDGTASSDPDGNISAYSWSQLSGPVVSLTNATSASPTFTAPRLKGLSQVNIMFSLVVTDDNGKQSSADQVNITVVKK